MKLELNSKNESIASDLIYQGIQKGDSLSVIMFVLSLNPLSHLLKHTKGTAYVENRRQQHIYNFFVDDLKLYSTSINNIKNQLDIVTNFSKDIAMTFGVDKCAYSHIKKGKIVKSGLLTINNLTIQLVATGDNYRYLGIDENIEYSGSQNKERISKEFLNRVKKIWSS